MLQESISFLNDVVNQIIIGFAVFYVILLLAYKFIPEESFKDRLMKPSIQILKFVGLFYFLHTISYVFSLLQSNTASGVNYKERILGHYWYTFWHYPMIVFTIYITCWLEFRSKFIVLALLSLFYLFDINTFLIILTDYIDDPSNINLLPFFRLIHRYVISLAIFGVVFVFLKGSSALWSYSRKSLH
jgi:hypothetical protein